MDVNEWAFTFSDIVGKALTLDLLSEGVNHNAALQVITWIEHVYTDYTGVGTIYKRLLRSGLGFGAKRWVSILKRQCQRILSANVPSSTHDFNNLVKLNPEGRRGLLMIAERMVNYFTFGITGSSTGSWTEVKGNFGSDVRMMSTRAMDDPGLPTGTRLRLLLRLCCHLPQTWCLITLRDYKHRKEWDISASGHEYEPVCRIPYGEEPSNCVSIYNVMTRRGHMLELQESWSNPVASHVVFASTEIWTIDAILRGGDPNGLPLMPYGFTIFPDGPSSPVDGSSGTLLTVSCQVLISKSPMADIDSIATIKVAQFLK
ncbi:homeobox-leucine zipper protein HDG2-like, partial [Apium graveolens]|uniref:homeobox-leucine zipper protein HDG2-like n=1 Tax=Apium graveolens TaxID=4045 RepID=UPI003D7B75F1